MRAPPRRILRKLVSAPGQGQVDMAEVDWFFIDGEETGYAEAAAFVGRLRGTAPPAA